MDSNPQLTPMVSSSRLTVVGFAVVDDGTLYRSMVEAL